MKPDISVLIGCYGNFPEYSLRAVESVVQRDEREQIEVHVGCNACGARTIARLRELLDAGDIDTLIESRRNLNKDPMMRLLVDLSRAPYVLWMDDDSHLLPGWASPFLEFLGKQKPFDCAGHIFYWHKDDYYRGFLTRRPWYLDEDSYLEPSDHAQRTWFATGGLFLARAQYLRQHNFPDRRMIKGQDDILLGDLISQQHGRLVGFSDEIMQHVRISDGERRGTGASNFPDAE
jgi:hypothetical protein